MNLNEQVLNVLLNEATYEEAGNVLQVFTEIADSDMVHKAITDMLDELDAMEEFVIVKEFMPQEEIAARIIRSRNHCAGGWDEVDCQEIHEACQDMGKMQLFYIPGRMVDFI